MDDSDAIARLKQGDIGGLEHLVARYQVEAVRTAYLITRDRGLAEDVVQSSFLRIAARIAQFDASRPFAPWLMRCVVNDTLKLVARQRRSVSLDSLALLASVAPSPDELANAAETSAEVWAALGRLSADQRAAIVLRYYLGMSEAEMSAQLDIPPGTVKWRLHAARQRLRSLLPAWLHPEPEPPAPIPPPNKGEQP
ncbi:MAG: RNA polymerase subunit sigma-24 [Candidatus Chloroheliales bacterium]|nr:MAG: RNA polymerase subunit sigma-24 [Chloroflexota bacterium]